MLRRDFCSVAGAATGWLLFGGMPRLAFGLPGLNDNHLQIATSRAFGPGDIVLDIAGGVKPKNYDTVLVDGQEYFWRQTVLVDGQHMQVYHGRLVDDLLRELLDLYDDELLPFIETVNNPPKDDDDDQGDDHDYGDDGGGRNAGKTSGAETPERFDLGQNYPNPFSGRTTIPVSIPEAGHVQVTVYDAAGREVSTLANSLLRAGTYRFDFEADGLPSGMYTVVLRANGASRTRQLTLIR
jgi:hypothetical protein